MSSTYSSYQETGVSWMPYIPSSWELMRGKRCFFTKKELNADGKIANILSLTLRGVIRNDADRPIGLAPRDYATYQIFNPGDLVFKLIDLENISTSRVGLVPERGIMSSAYIRLIPRAECNIKYFFFQYYDLYLRHVFNGLGAGVRSTLNAHDLLELSVAVPPIDEQDQMVRFLEWKIASISKLIASKNKEIRLLRERLAAQISEIVMQGLHSEAVTKESGIEWVGRIPSHWQTIRCKYLFTERDERSAEGLEDHLSMSQKYGLIPDSQLGERRMLSESYKGGKLCYEDDLVLNRLKAHLGVFALSSQLGVISPDYTVLIPNTDRILPAYAETVLKSVPCRRELRIRVRGIVEGFWRLYTDDFGTIVLPVPPLDEQREIMQRVDGLRESTKKYEAILSQEIDILKELKNRIISDVVAGKIDVRDIEVPEYEPVEEVAETDTEDAETVADMEQED